MPLVPVPLPADRGRIGLSRIGIGGIAQCDPSHPSGGPFRPMWGSGWRRRQTKAPTGHPGVFCCGGCSPYFRCSAWSVRCLWCSGRSCDRRPRFLCWRGWALFRAAGAAPSARLPP